MIDITKDIQSLTTFRRRSGDFMKQLKKTKRPVVLTVKGKAKAVVQDAAAYQRLLDIAALADPREGIRQGLEDVAQRQGKTCPGVLRRIPGEAWHTALGSPVALQRDLDAIYIAVGANTQTRLFVGSTAWRRHLFTLRNSPHRCPTTPEDPPYRHLLYGKKPQRLSSDLTASSNSEKNVEILHIRHGARQAFQPGDLK